MAFDHQIDEAELLPKRTTKHRFRARIFAEWNHQCAYCANPADTLDHVVPRVGGGLTVAKNLVPACRQCNGAKSGSDWQEWFKDQPYWMPSREDAVRRWLSSDDKIP
jgi:5-methylcytosine-specific restriction endonuclease McrA